MKKIKLILALSLIWQSSYSQNFTLKSNDLSGQITSNFVFNNFGCTGQNLSPQLYWENIPEGTKSFAITMYDPDAPTGSGWTHWNVFNITKDVYEILQGAGDLAKNLMPKEAIQSLNDFGFNGYGGPCPPTNDGPHHYIFTVYALKVEKIDLNKDVTPAMLGYYLNSFTIEKASIISYYKQ